MCSHSKVIKHTTRTLSKKKYTTEKKTSDIWTVYEKCIYNEFKEIKEGLEISETAKDSKNSRISFT